MRVLEPPARPTKRQPRHHPVISTRLKRLALLVVALAVGYVLFGQTVRKPSAGQHNESAGQTVQAPKKTLKQFTAEEFKAAYSTYVYPNTQLIEDVPSITGDEAADARIRRLAEKRGYKLTAVPVASIVKTDETGLTGDDLIQPNALIAWQKLKAAASQEGVTLTLTSAYRSIAYQRSLFTQRLNAAGVNVARILEGYADDEIDAVLSRAAPPGYSRHHTGYTIDLSCNGVGLEAFIRTSCYEWLSRNNFEVVKTYGWVPSYPEGVGGSGPEPESWEYVWVGTGSTYE